MNLDLRERINLEIVMRRLAVTAARTRLKAEEKEAAKENRKVPRVLYDRLMADLHSAEDAVQSAVISLEAVSRFPPLNRGV